MWQNWTNGILGLALVFIAFMGLSGAAQMWTLGILGALIAIIGFWGVSPATTKPA